MILDCIHLNKAFGDNCICEDASFRIEDNDRVAIVGVNGCGKTTMIKMLLGKETYDSGEVVIPQNLRIGYLSQDSSLDSNRNIYDEIFSTREDFPNMESQLRQLEELMKTADTNELEILMKKYDRINEDFARLGGYEYKSRVTGILNGMGFDEESYGKSVSSLSGGEKTRLSLGKLLLMPLDLLILDEPTNHLDLKAVAWLETYLSAYKGALLIVSHDRYFLNKVVSKIVDMDNGKVRVYSGNYEQYAVKKRMLVESAIKAYKNQQRNIEHQEKVIEKLRSFNREKSIKRAESRVKMLDKVERLEKVDDSTQAMKLNLTAGSESGKDVLHVEDVSKSFEKRNLFEKVSFNIYKGDKIALIGDNGAGKTTLIKIIMKELPLDNGFIKIGANVEIGYFDQEHAVLDRKKTIFEEISDSYPMLTQTKIRNTMAAFLFTDDEVFSPIGLLSGGEQGRVALAKLMLSKANFLILDEPTNHLDIMSKEILEEAINNYQGTVLYISHDRYFINKTARRIFNLNNMKIDEYLGNYDEYIEKTHENNTIIDVSSDKNESDSKMDWKKSKEESARQKKRENEISSIEKRLEEIELEKDKINSKMNSDEYSASYSKLSKLTEELNLLEKEEEELFMKWDSLS